MAEYFDLVSSIQQLINVWNEHSEIYEGQQEGVEAFATTGHGAKRRKLRCPIDSNFLEVRPSVCVAGLHWRSLQKVKAVISSLHLDPAPLESLHVKRPSDVKDGALLVPKVVLVGEHCAGRRLIDDDGDSGQLDYIYDEVCDMGADVFVVYLGLPRSIYKPMRHMVYHPRLIDVVFPDQPVLRRLAEDNLLVTLVDGQDEFTLMQKNVLKEWLEKPVGDDHPVYKAAGYLSAAEVENYGRPEVVPRVSFYSETEVQRRRAPEPLDGEEHPLAEKRQKRKKKEKRKLFRKQPKGYRQLPQNDLMQFEDDVEEEHGIEMDIYGRSGNPVESFTKLSV